ncbi:MAG TPA: hypothetical protein VEZ11_07375 [Thermoanaerobaculia bacterium]|nr:hypothetical protein [Thermoanaerobaculia bacterium]
MEWLGTITVAGLVVLAILIWLFLRTRSKDLIEEMMVKRRSTSRLVTRADFVEGMNHFPVLLALTDDALFYENPELQASIDRSRIDEVEYDDELAIGKSVPHGGVLRLRSHGQMIEFVVDDASAKQWKTALPGRVLGDPNAAAV